MVQGTKCVTFFTVNPQIVTDWLWQEFWTSSFILGFNNTHFEG